MSFRFRFGTASERALKGVHPVLVHLWRTAIAHKGCPVDVRILEGLRTIAKQREYVRKKVSWTMNSKHLTGHAVDAVVLINGKLSWSWAPYYPLAKHVKKIAKAEGIEVTWGGDWKKTPDGVHWELDPKKYPMPK